MRSAGEYNATGLRRSSRKRSIPEMVTRRQTLMKKVFCDLTESKNTKENAKSKVPKESSTETTADSKTKPRKRKQLNDEESETVAMPKNHNIDEQPNKRACIKPSSSAPIEGQKDLFLFSEINVGQTEWFKNLQNIVKKEFQPKNNDEYDICSVETSKRIIGERFFFVFI